MFIAFQQKGAISYIHNTYNFMVESEDFFPLFFACQQTCLGLCLPSIPQTFLLTKLLQGHSALHPFRGFRQWRILPYSTLFIKQVNCKYKQTNINRDNQIKVLGVSRKKRYSLYESLLWFTTLVALIRSKLQ